MIESRTRNRRVVAAVVAAVVLLVGATVAAGSSPDVCARCHDDVVSASSHTAHASTSCYSCHAPGVRVAGFKVREILEMYPRGIVGRRPQGAVEEISRDACLRCHSVVLKRPSSGSSTGIRIAHADCATEASCDPCHAGTAHGEAVRWQRGPVMERCVACHRERSADIGCETCHDVRVQADRLTSGPWQVTHGPRWEQTHGMGDLDSCSTCHPDDYCTRCHKVAVPHDATFGASHGPSAVADRQSCLDCHRSERFCDACHGTEMPHPDGFLERHSSAARTIENPACQRCHAVEDCQICHRRHVHPGYARISAGVKPPGGSE